MRFCPSELDEGKGNEQQGYLFLYNNFYIKLSTLENPLSKRRGDFLIL